MNWIGQNEYEKTSEQERVRDRDGTQTNLGRWLNSYVSLILIAFVGFIMERVHILVGRISSSRRKMSNNIRSLIVHVWCGVVLEIKNMFKELFNNKLGKHCERRWGPVYLFIYGSMKRRLYSTNVPTAMQNVPKDVECRCCHTIQNSINAPQETLGPKIAR